MFEAKQDGFRFMTSEVNTSLVVSKPVAYIGKILIQLLFNIPNIITLEN